MKIEDKKKHEEAMTKAIKLIIESQEKYRKLVNSQLKIKYK
tara:strand:- start:9 stop:131 length:123 start_codon:yes stop_codon:yes gene_type:complete